MSNGATKDMLDKMFKTKAADVDDKLVVSASSFLSGIISQKSLMERILPAREITFMLSPAEVIHNAVAAANAGLSREMFAHCPRRAYVILPEDM